MKKCTGCQAELPNKTGRCPFCGMDMTKIEPFDGEDITPEIVIEREETQADITAKELAFEEATSRDDFVKASELEEGIIKPLKPSDVETPEEKEHQVYLRDRLSKARTMAIVALVIDFIGLGFVSFILSIFALVYSSKKVENEINNAGEIDYKKKTKITRIIAAVALALALLTLVGIIAYIVVAMNAVSEDDLEAVGAVIRVI